MPFNLTKHHILGHKPGQPSASDDHSSNKKRDFDISREAIGSGGYSQVVTAKWKIKGGMVVALKVVNKTAVKDREEYLKIVGV
jgi:serine/threonine protein kinase